MQPDVTEWMQLGKYHTPVERKAEELFDSYVALEAQLADPQNVAVVGRAYARLSAWNKEHMWDNDLQEVLDWLKPEQMYPPWRRQALEEAYRLFYEEIMIDSTPEDVADLPEPPTSEEIGFRRLPEALVSGKAVHEPVYVGMFEDKSACPINRSKWEYEIHRTEVSGRRANGRSIMAKNDRLQTRSNNLQVLQQVSQAFLPKDQCCARADEARKARGPFFLPEGFHAKPLRPPGATASSPQRPPRRLPRKNPALDATALDYHPDINA